jgi:hypothetical protein
MSSENYRPTKLFTIQQANAALPLVRAITGDIVRLSREILERRARLSHLTSGRSGEVRDVYSEELSHVEDELEKENRRLQEYVGELRQLGVELKGAPDGLVDFPAQMDGRIVYLCWKYNEPEVLYWHELEAGFAGRQALTADSGYHPEGSSGDAFEN